MQRPLPEVSAFPLELSDRCVKCGLCLPHCPTYQLEPIEGESPRGRISLMQGLASGALTSSEGLLSHLDHCLGCRACEKVCPADVPYGQLIDATRAGLRQNGIRPCVLWRLIAWTVSSRFRTRIVFGLLRFAMFLRLDRLMRRAISADGTAGQYLELLPPRLSRGRFAGRYPCDGPGRQGVVSLFLGCLGPALESDTLRAAIRVLNGMGYEVRVPAGQGCCGAIHQHAGYAAEAARFAKNNLRAFDPEIPVVVVSTGCLASLRDYPRMLDESSLADDGAASFAERCIDLTRFIRNHPAEVPDYSIALHVPCTQGLDPHDAEAATAIASRLSGGRCRQIGDGMCCGAAGTYLVEQPGISRQLADRISLPNTGVLVTSNIGCRLQIEAICRSRNVAARVVHPVSLFDTANPPP